MQAAWTALAPALCAAAFRFCPADEQARQGANPGPTRSRSADLRLVAAFGAGRDADPGPRLPYPLLAAFDLRSGPAAADPLIVGYHRADGGTWAPEGALARTPWVQHPFNQGIGSLLGAVDSLGQADG